jgi:hypothetical protein
MGHGISAKCGPALLSTKAVDKFVDCAWAVVFLPAKHGHPVGMIKISSAFFPL